MEKNASADTHSKGLLLCLGDYAPGTLLSETRLAGMLGKHVETIRRWRRNGALPESVALGQERVWTVQCLLDHVTKRLDCLAEKKRLLEKRLSGLFPQKG